MVTPHNPEAIRRFSDENTLVLDRHSHLEPTVIRPLQDMAVTGDLVSNHARKLRQVVDNCTTDKQRRRADPEAGD